MGRKPAQLDGPKLPEELAYVWEWFREVFNGEPLTFTELYHWAQMTGKRPSGWEADLIKSLDRIFWSVQYGQPRNPSTTR